MFIKRKCTLTSLSPPGFKSFPLFLVELSVPVERAAHFCCLWVTPGEKLVTALHMEAGSRRCFPFSELLCCTVEVQLLLAAAWDCDGGKRRRGESRVPFSESSADLEVMQGSSQSTPHQHTHTRSFLLSQPHTHTHKLSHSHKKREAMRKGRWEIGVRDGGRWGGLGADRVRKRGVKSAEQMRGRCVMISYRAGRYQEAVWGFMVAFMLCQLGPFWTTGKPIS